MGKHTEHKNHHGGIPTDKSDKSNHDRKWTKMLNNINVLDHHHSWNIKKILPHKKQGEGYESMESSEEEVNVGEKTYVCNGDVCTVSSSHHEEKTAKEASSSKKAESSHHEEKTAKEASSSKKGCAARIKAKTKEVLKKKVRHKRSSNSPPHAGITDSDSSHSEQSATVKDTSHVDPLAADEKDSVSCTAQMDHPVDVENHMDKGKEVVAENSKNDSDSSDEEQEQPFPLKLNNIEHLSRSATLHQSKELLDAMDVLSMNKDFFLKVLADPEASLAQHFRAQQAAAKGKRLDKSMTFPRPCSSDLGIKPNTNTSRKDKQFKDLRQKIKHVIKESKEERHRIALDSVLDKVPYGHQYSETKNGAIDQLNLEMDGRETPRSSRKDKKRTVKRSPSVNASMERYRQLLETSVEKASRHTSQSPLKLRSKDHNGSLRQVKTARGSLGRMSSSPDLSLWLHSQLADSHSGSPCKSPNWIPLPRRSLITTTRSFNESNSQLMLSYLEKGGTEEEGEGEGCCTPLVKDGEPSSEDSHLSQPQDPVTDLFSLAEKTAYLDEPLDHPPNSSHHAQVKSKDRGYFDYVKDVLHLSGYSAPSDTIDSHLSQPQDPVTDLFSLAENTAYLDEPLDHPPNSSHHAQVKSKDRGYFDYVKDVLHLSGYFEDQALGNWQSDQPMDPSLYEELEGCSLQQPVYSESEEGNECNRLLLFDSINEVLLSTYERSMVYWNRPLTTCSRIHPMPKGYCVLEEVWSHLSWYLNSRANQLESSLDHCYNA